MRKIILQVWDKYSKLSNMKEIYFYTNCSHSIVRPLRCIDNLFIIIMTQNRIFLLKNNYHNFLKSQNISIKMDIYSNFIQMMELITQAGYQGFQLKHLVVRQFVRPINTGILKRIFCTQENLLKDPSNPNLCNNVNLSAYVLYKVHD